MFFREWFAVFCILCFVAMLSFMEAFPARPPHFLCEPMSPLKIQVKVFGAVEKPGIYDVEVGSTLKSVLDQAGFKKTADRRGLYLRKKILSSCSLTVPEKKCRKNKKKKKSLSSIAFTS